MILGTAAYMSPEQARGLPVDARADIWAFGCVLYEMLTGRPPFTGQTVAETLAAILEREPDWKALPSSTPARIRELLRHCLQRDIALRLQNIAEARAHDRQGRSAEGIGGESPRLPQPRRPCWCRWWDGRCSAMPAVTAR